MARIASLSRWAGVIGVCFAVGTTASAQPQRLGAELQKLLRRMIGQ